MPPFNRHPPRLNRDLQHRCVPAGYAMENLHVELASAIDANELDIPTAMPHASCRVSWIKPLKDDERESSRWAASRLLRVKSTAKVR